MSFTALLDNLYEFLCVHIFTDYHSIFGTIPVSFWYLQLTVQAQLRHLFPHLADKQLGHEFRFSHRLDFATSGLLCISLTKPAAKAITKCFTKGQVDKYYLALVRGHLSQEMLDISLPIGEEG